MRNENRKKKIPLSPPPPPLPFPSYLPSHEAPPRRDGLRVVLCRQDRVDLVDERAFAVFLKSFECFFSGAVDFDEVFFFFSASCWSPLPSSLFFFSHPPPLPHSRLPVTVLLGAVRAAAAIPVSAGGPKAKKALFPFFDALASDAGWSWLLLAAASEDAAEAGGASSRAAPAARRRRSSTLGSEEEERCEFFF